MRIAYVITRADAVGGASIHVANETCELDYIRYRLLDRPRRAWIAAALRFPPLGWTARAVFRKLAFLVIFSRKAAA